MENGFSLKDIDARGKVTFQNKGNKPDVHKETELVKRTRTKLAKQSTCFFNSR